MASSPESFGAGLTPGRHARHNGKVSVQINIAQSANEAKRRFIPGGV